MILVFVRQGDRRSMSGVYDKEDHYNENEKQNDDSAYLTHIVSFQQLSQFCLHKVHFLHSVVHIIIKFSNEMTLLRQLRVNLSTLLL